jgi:hypothetical protein
MAMLMMMPDDIANLIYKQVFNGCVKEIKRGATYRKYGFKYELTKDAEAVIDNTEIMSILNTIINYLNENVIQKDTTITDFNDDDEEYEVCFRHYLLTDEPKSIPMNILVKTYHRRYESLNADYKNEINNKVLEKIFNGKIPTAIWNWETQDYELEGDMISNINKMIRRSNYKHPAIDDVIKPYGYDDAE